jgi:hypothetical protein
MIQQEVRSLTHSLTHSHAHSGECRRGWQLLLPSTADCCGALEWQATASSVRDGKKSERSVELFVAASE